jgi:tetratricopeptide (TPR) repeat protein
VIGSALVVGGKPRRRVLLALLVVGAVWHAAGTVRIHPHYLAYFNEVAGGPMGGPRYLIDSNIDWGQDEKLLAGFISEEPDTVLVNPGPFAPSVGTIAVNVNSIKGIFRGDDSGYGWLKQFDPERTLGYTWYVYRLEADDFRRSLSESDADAEPRFWRAIALQKEGRLEEGLSELRSIANEFPDLKARARRTAGRLLVRAARYEEGIEELRKAAEVDDDPEVRASLEAAVVKERWSRDEATADELMWLGRHYAERGDSRRAREALEAGLVMAPADARHQLTMARFSGHEGRFEEAVTYADKAVELASGLAPARQVREDARRLAAMEKLDDSFEARMTLAGLDSRYGRPASAARHYWRAFNLDPSSQDALTAMGEIIVRAKLGVLKLETEWPSWEPSKR